MLLQPSHRCAGCQANGYLEHGSFEREARTNARRGNREQVPAPRSSEGYIPIERGSVSRNFERNRMARMNREPVNQAHFHSRAPQGRNIEPERNIRHVVQRRYRRQSVRRAQRRPSAASRRANQNGSRREDLTFGSDYVFNMPSHRFESEVNFWVGYFERDVLSQIRLPPHQSSTSRSSTGSAPSIDHPSS